MFGRDSYFLSKICLENNEEIERHRLKEEYVRKLLSHPCGTAEYVTQAILMNTHYAVRDSLNEFSLRYKEFQKYSFSEKINISIQEHNQKSYAVIDFDSLEEFILASKNFPAELYMVKLVSEKSDMGYVLFKNQQIVIFSDHNLFLKGYNNLHALFINTISEVFFSEKIRTTFLNIFCHSIEINSEDIAPLIETHFFNITARQQAKIKGVIRTQAGGLFRTGEIWIEKEIESSNDGISIVAEKVHIYHDLAARKQLSIYSMDCQVYEDEKHSPHIHAKNITISTVNPSNLSGILSTNTLNIFNNQVIFNNKIFIEGSINIHSTGEDAKLEITKNALCIFNGHSSYKSDKIAWIEGSFKENQHLKVRWKRIVNPIQSLTEEQELLGKKSLTVMKELKSDEPAKVIFLPYISPDQLSFYSEDDLPLFDPKEKKPVTDISYIQFSAPHLNIKGDISLTTGSLSLKGDKIYFSGNLADQSILLAPAGLLVEAADLIFKNSKIAIAAPISIMSSNFNSDMSEVKAKELKIESGDISFQGENSYSASSSILVKAERKIEIQPKSTLALLSPKPILIDCYDFNNEGKLTFEELHIRAKHLISMLHAEMHGKKLFLESRYLFGLLSTFDVEDSFSVSSMVTLLGGCYIATNRYVNDGLFNLSTSIYVPGKNFKLNDTQSFIALIMASLNTTISILHLVSHDPVAQATLAISRFAINFIPSLINTAKLATQIYEASEKELDQGKWIKLANQLKTFVYSFVNLGYNFSAIIPPVNHFSFDSIPLTPLPKWDTLGTINNLNNIVLPLATMTQLGKSESSFVHIHLNSFEMSSSFANSSVVSLNGDLLKTSLISSRQSIISLDVNSASFALIPGFSTDMGIMKYSMSNDSMLPMGSNSERFYEINSNNLIPLKKNSENIESYIIKMKGDQEYKNSSIHSHEFSNSDHIKLKNSQLIVSEMTGGGALSAVQSSIKIMSNLNSNKNILLHNSSLEIKKEFNNNGKLEGIDSFIKTNEIHNKPKSELVTQRSKLEVTSLINESEIYLDQSQLKTEQIINHSSSYLLAVDSSIQSNEIMNEKNSATQLLSSHLETKKITEEGILAINLESDLKIDKAIFSESAQISSQGSNWNVHDLESKVDFDLELDKSASYTVEKDNHHHHHELPKDKSNEFKYTSDSSLIGALKESVIVYDSKDPIKIHDRNIISLLPIEINAPTVTFSGKNSSNAPILLKDAKTIFNHGKDIFNVLEIKSKNIDFLDCKVIAETIHAESDQLNMTGGKLVGAEITINSKEVDVEGTKEVEKIKKVHHGFFSKSTEYTEKTTFQNAVIESNHISITAEKSLQLSATDINSDIIYLASQHETFTPLSGNNIHEQKNSNLIHTHTISEHVGVESISHLNGKNILIEGDKIDLHGVTLAGEKVEIHGKEISGSRSILPSTYDEKEKGISIKLPHLPKVSELPLVSAIHDFKHSNNLIDSSSAVSDMITGTSNLAGEILNGQILPFQLDPTFTVKIGEKQTHLFEEHLGEGRIIADELILDGEKIALSNNYGLDAKHTYINSKSFTASSGELKMDYVSTNKQLILNKGLFSSDIGFSTGKDHIHQTYNIGGDLQSDDLVFNVENVNFEGQYFQVNHLSGQVGTLDSKTALNQFYHQGIHSSIFYNGGFSWDKQNEYSQSVNSISPFIFVNPLSSCEDFFVTHLNLTGQSSQGIGYHYYSETPVSVFDIKHSTHIDGSWRDILGISQASQIFSSMHYAFSHNHYSGSKGDILQVLSNNHLNYHLSIPIYHINADQTLLEKLRYFIVANNNSLQASIVSKYKEVIPTSLKNKISYFDEIDFGDLYTFKQQSNEPAILNFEIKNIVSHDIDDEIKIDLPFEIGKELIDSSNELLHGRYNLIEFFNENRWSFSDIYEEYWKNILSKSSPVCRSIFNSISCSIDIDPVFFQLPVDVILNKTPFSFSKINLLKYGGYGLFGVSSGLSAYSIYKSDNRIEETARIGALAITGSAGWELGEALAGLVCAVDAPFCAGGLALAGAIGINVMADYDWHQIKEKIEMNMELDRDLPRLSLEPFSFFKPKLIEDPSFDLFSLNRLKSSILSFR